MKTVSALLVSILLSAPLTLYGQSLYGSGISPEKALVRVIFTNPNSDLIIDIGSEGFAASLWEEGALYHQVPPGMYFIECGDEFLEIILRSGIYYSLIIADNRCHLFEDLEHNSPAKTQVYYYNLLKGEKATLYVEETGDHLFTAVPPGESVQRAVNPLKKDFCLTTENGIFLELGQLPMNRGGSTSVITYMDGNNPVSLVLQAAIKES